MIDEVVKIPMYHCEINVIFDKDLSYTEKKYKTKSLKKFGAVTFRNKKKYRSYVVSFEYYSGSIIAHEVVHLINYIYLDCGIELDMINDENQAYLTGWLFDEIDKILNME